NPGRSLFRRPAMTNRWVAQLVLALGLSASIAGQSDSSGDWPQWHGPDRSNLSKETGLLKQWPPSGPPLVWSVSGGGAGYGSIAVKDERIFLQGAVGGRSIVYALNRADGKNLWSKALGAAGNNDKGTGPRSTPTVDDDRLYVLTENGDLACLKTDGTA